MWSPGPTPPCAGQGNIVFIVSVYSAAHEIKVGALVIPSRTRHSHCGIMMQAGEFPPMSLRLDLLGDASIEGRMDGSLTVQALILAHRHSNPGAVKAKLTSWFFACRPFLNLLGDESNAVRVQVMASLVQTLDQFCIANEEARTRAFADFLPALLAADAGCGYCWRIHHHLMLALPHFVHMFTSDEVCPFV